MLKRRLQVLTVNVCKLLYFISLVISLICLFTNNHNGFVLLQVYAVCVILVQAVVFSKMKKEPISEEELYVEWMTDEIKRYIKSTKKTIMATINKTTAVKAFLYSIEEKEVVLEDMKRLKMKIHRQKELCTQIIDSMEAMKKAVDMDMFSKGEEEIERIKGIYVNSKELVRELIDNEKMLTESKEEIMGKLAALKEGKDNV